MADLVARLKPQLVGGNDTTDLAKIGLCERTASRRAGRSIILVAWATTRVGRQHPIGRYDPTGVEVRQHNLPK